MASPTLKMILNRWNGSPIPAETKESFQEIANLPFNIELFCWDNDELLNSSATAIGTVLALLEQNNEINLKSDFGKQLYDLFERLLDKTSQS